MYFLRILSVMLLSTIAFISNAQITGKVFDSVTHEPLIGANIEANGAGTVTNQQGQFSLKIRQQASLFLLLVIKKQRFPRLIKRLFQFH
jgi:hypothetical protein